MIEDLTFLENGPFTRVDDNVREAIERLKSSPRRTQWGRISEFVSGLRLDETKKYEEFRRRTTSEIINSDYVVGCSDVALVFITLSRELGIPTRYVEVFNRKWINSQDFNRVDGHAFVDIFVDNEWCAYEPKVGFTRDGRYSLGDREYVEVGKGLDFSQVYLKFNGFYLPQPISLQSLDDLKQIGLILSRES